ncbi:unnamed protein product [Fraxinus pennsylvanica]|uniref:Uncharacterized protein n=1 Tax=Fraxinus pennsylvanica TaxID=56036 RepID=A0AAD2DW67_9LAMI|nr:unnamed protein product [Fraxinus pennsylvanica]
MLCNSFLKSASLHLRPIRKHSELRQFSCVWRVLNATQSFTYLSDCKFARTRNMMVDSGATARGGQIVDLLPEKDDGGYARGGWKCEDGRSSCGYSSFRGKRVSMRIFMTSKLPRLMDKQSVFLGYLMVRSCPIAVHLKASR